MDAASNVATSELQVKLAGRQLKASLLEAAQASESFKERDRLLAFYVETFLKDMVKRKDELQRNPPEKKESDKIRKLAETTAQKEKDRGDDSVEERLNLMDEYLSEFDASPESKPGSQIEWQQKTITEPIWQKHPYPVGADQPETHMVHC